MKKQPTTQKLGPIVSVASDGDAAHCHCLHEVLTVKSSNPSVHHVLDELPLFDITTGKVTSQCTFDEKHLVKCLHGLLKSFSA